MKKEYKRQCPTCFKDICYTSYRSYWMCKKAGYGCKECGHIKRHNNPNWRTNISKNHADQSGSNNGMYGKTVYDGWVVKYGKEQADEMRLDTNKKKSRPGKLNGMYGKPSPKGSGNGWSGWYKNWFFRSLRELSYMINVIEKNNWSWLNGELKKYAISYIDYNGQQRNYFPDFIINDILMVEIKPIRLHSSYTVQQKAKAAQKFCELNGLEYRLEDCKILLIDELKNLYDEGIIKFTDKTLSKFLNY